MEMFVESAGILGRRNTVRKNVELRRFRDHQLVGLS